MRLPNNKLTVTRLTKNVGVERFSKKCARPHRQAPCAFKDSMIHGVLRFTLRFAFRCVLHRCENQDIHCRKSYFNLFEEKKVFFWGLANNKIKNTEKGKWVCTKKESFDNYLLGGSICRFTYRYLVTTFTSSTSTSLRTLGTKKTRANTSIPPVNSLDDASEIATGGVYKGQGRNRWTLVTPVY